MDTLTSFAHNVADKLNLKHESVDAFVDSIRKAMPDMDDVDRAKYVANLIPQVISAGKGYASGGKVNPPDPKLQPVTVTPNVTAQDLTNEGMNLANTPVTGTIPNINQANSQAAQYAATQTPAAMAAAQQGQLGPLMAEEAYQAASGQIPTAAGEIANLAPTQLAQRQNYGNTSLNELSNVTASGASTQGNAITNAIENARGQAIWNPGSSTSQLDQGAMVNPLYRIKVHQFEQQYGHAPNQQQSMQLMNDAKNEAASQTEGSIQTSTVGRGAMLPVTSQAELGAAAGTTGKIQQIGLKNKYNLTNMAIGAVQRSGAAWPAQLWQAVAKQNWSQAWEYAKNLTPQQRADYSYVQQIASEDPALFAGVQNPAAMVARLRQYQSLVGNQYNVLRDEAQMPMYAEGGEVESSVVPGIDDKVIKDFAKECLEEGHNPIEHARRVFGDKAIDVINAINDRREGKEVALHRAGGGSISPQDLVDAQIVAQSLGMGGGEGGPSMAGVHQMGRFLQNSINQTDVSNTNQLPADQTPLINKQHASTLLGAIEHIGGDFAEGLGFSGIGKTILKKILPRLGAAGEAAGEAEAAGGGPEDPAADVAALGAAGAELADPELADEAGSEIKSGGKSLLNKLLKVSGLGAATGAAVTGSATPLQSQQPQQTPYEQDLPLEQGVNAPVPSESMNQMLPAELSSEQLNSQRQTSPGLRASQNPNEPNPNISQGIGINSPALNSGQNPNSTNAITQTIRTVSSNQGVPTALAMGIAKTESDMNPKALNHNKNGSTDYGVFQVNGINKPRGWNENDMLNPQKNIELGVGILGNLLKKFGNVPQAVFAYNHGPGLAMTTPMSVIQKDPYVQRVLANEQADKREQYERNKNVNG